MADSDFEFDPYLRTCLMKHQPSPKRSKACSRKSSLRRGYPHVPRCSCGSMTPCRRLHTGKSEDTANCRRACWQSFCWYRRTQSSQLSKWRPAKGPGRGYLSIFSNHTISNQSPANGSSAVMRRSVLQNILY